MSDPPRRPATRAPRRSPRDRAVLHVTGTRLGPSRRGCRLGAQPARNRARLDPGGAVAIVVGVIFRKVGDSFKRVVDTRGDDLGNLMEALRGLSSAFQTQIVAVGVAVGVGLLLVLAGS